MSSVARQHLAARLLDFDELIEARDAICPSGAGRPAQKRGRAVIRGAVVLLAAAFEAYVEDLFDCCVDQIYASATAAQLKQLKKNTSGRLNNADVFKVNLLFFNAGISWICSHPHVHWQKCTNAKVQTTLNKLVATRNSIAHGGSGGAGKTQAKYWRTFVERLADRLDEVVRVHIESHTGTTPW